MKNIGDFDVSLYWNTHSCHSYEKFGNTIFLFDTTRASDQCQLRHKPLECPVFFFRDGPLLADEFEWQLSAPGIVQRSKREGHFW